MQDLDHSNHDMCDNCGEGGDLLCCDRCPASFHLLCAEPPLSVIPDGDWYCKQCTATLYPVPPHTLSKNPVVATLLSKLRAMNPVVYTLPKEIYEVAKKGKSFTELGEGGRQMGSGTTAVDVFGNRVLQGVCRYVLLVHIRTSYTIKILSPIIILTSYRILLILTQ